MKSNKSALKRGKLPKVIYASVSNTGHGHYYLTSSSDLEEVEETRESDFKDIPTYGEYHLVDVFKVKREYKRIKVSLK